MGKQVKVNGETSDWYELAVFHLKEGVNEQHIPCNLLDYAENLIEKNLKLKKVVKGYETSAMPVQQKKDNDKGWIDCFFWGSIGLFIVLSLCYILI